jgi:hypothetical protein
MAAMMVRGTIVETVTTRNNKCKVLAAPYQID